MDTPRPTLPDRLRNGFPDDPSEWLRLLVNVQPFPSLLVGCESGEVVLSNEAAREIAHPAAGPGAPYATDADGARVEAAALPSHLAALQPQLDGAEITWHAADGERTFQVRSRALPVPQDAMALCLLTFVDVTAQKVAEVELRQALEARDEFFSVATHELRDPLFSLQLSIQLLQHTAQRQGDVPDYVAYHLEVGQRQTERLSRLIDNLLDVSRITNQRLHLEIEALDLCALAHEAAARFRDKADTVGSSLEAEPCAPVIGYFDRLKMEQVVNNLVSNALKYGAGKPVAVRVFGAGDTAVLEVEDQGIGIAPEHHDRIFERFERASAGHKKESLGLGLYIVRSIVDAHGGSIRVRSEPRQGSTFTVVLPRTGLHHGRGAAPPPSDGATAPPGESRQ